MPKSVRALIVCGVLLLAPLGANACGGSSDEVLARVGAGAISKSSFEHWMSVANAMSPTEARALFPDPSGSMTLKQRVLSYLIASTRTIAEAQEAGLAVARSETIAKVERLHFEQVQGLSLGGQSEPASFRFARAETTSDRIWIITVHTLAEKVEQHRLAEAEQLIPRAQTARYYTGHKGDFVVPEKRDVAVIQSFTRANGELARREIASGKSLLSVVASRNEEAGPGGYKRGLSGRDLRHDYERNYFTAPPHVLFGPFQFEIFYLFEVTAIMPAKQQQFSEVQAQIRRRMVGGSQRGLLMSLRGAGDRAWKTRTRCRAALRVPQCGGVLS